MIFYLLHSGQTTQELTDHNIIGEVSFKSFHLGISWGVLQKLINSNNKTTLSKLSIVDSTGKVWEISSFLDYLKDYHFIQY
jgi:hypothetical protein